MPQDQTVTVEESSQERKLREYNLKLVNVSQDSEKPSIVVIMAVASGGGRREGRCEARVRVKLTKVLKSRARESEAEEGI